MKTSAALGAAVASALAATPAQAAVGPEGIRPGHNVTIFHNLDMVGTYGHVTGDRTQVDLFRGPHRIATAAGRAFSSPDGGAIEVNHGPVGAAGPGDCWNAATPDIRPGDRVVVSNPGDRAGVDEAIVDDIALTGRRRLLVDPATGEAAVPSFPSDPVTGQPSTTPVFPPGSREEVWVEGTAHFMNADGTPGEPMPLAQLDSGGFLDTADNQLRIAPNIVDAPLGAGTFRARYFAAPSFNVERNRAGHSNDYMLNALATGDGHAMGFGHVAPLPPLSMLVDGLSEQTTPALGCEAAPKHPSSAGTASADALNIANTGSVAGTATVLTIGGWAAAGVDAARVELSDASGTKAVAEVTGLSVASSAPQGWSAAFLKSDLDKLEQGTLSARLHSGGLAGGTVTVAYDTVAPTFDVSLVEGSYTGPQRLSVTGETDPVTYELDGDARRPYAGVPIELGVGTHALTLRSADAAGNVTARTLRYVISAAQSRATDFPVLAAPVTPLLPASPKVPAAPPVPSAPEASRIDAAPGADVRVPHGEPPHTGGPALVGLPSARMSRSGRSVSVASARRDGLVARFVAPRTATAAVVRLYRANDRGRIMLLSVDARVKPGSNALRLRTKALRQKLIAGRYILKIRLRTASGDLGKEATSVIRLRA